MVAEQYPELKADSDFVNLQNQIVAIENQVADRREDTTQGSRTGTQPSRCSRRRSSLA